MKYRKVIFYESDKIKIKGLEQIYFSKYIYEKAFNFYFQTIINLNIEWLNSTHLKFHHTIKSTLTNGQS